jgi:hypothetical protein
MLSEQTMVRNRDSLRIQLLLRVLWKVQPGRAADLTASRVLCHLLSQRVYEGEVVHPRRTHSETRPPTTPQRRISILG